VTTNVFILDAAPWLPAVYLVVAAAVAWRRWPRTTTLLRLTTPIGAH
jgi:hypothetical protein